VDGRPLPPRIFRGWYVVAASFTILFFNAGARYCFGVMLKPISAEFGWSRGDLSLVFSVNMVIFSLGLLVVGKMYDRYGPKWVIIVSTLLISAGFVMTSFMHSIGQFFFSYGVLAALGIAGTAVPLMATLTSKWFDRRRGLAVSLSLSGNSMGQFLLVQLLAFVAVDYGWRTSYRLIGIVMLVVNVLLALLVIRGDPSQLGLRPFGAEEQTGKEHGGATVVSASAGSPELGFRHAMATPSYWFFMVLMFICGGGDYFATTHFVPLASDNGVSLKVAGTMLGWYGAMSLIGVLLAGPAGDWIGSKALIIFTFVLRFFLFLLIYRYKSPGSLYLFALAFGLTHLVTAPLTPMLVAKMYGTANLGMLTGFVNTIHFLGGAAAGYMGGVVFDRTGDYQLALVISAVAALVAIGCGLCVRERRHGLPGSRPGAGLLARA
jgi:sugar phosphate permease